MRLIFIGLVFLTPQLSHAEVARPEYLSRVEAINRGYYDNPKSCQTRLGSFPKARVAADAIKANSVHFIFENWDVLTKRLFAEHGTPLAHSSVNREMWARIAVVVLTAEDLTGVFRKSSVQLDPREMPTIKQTSRDIDAMLIKFGLRFVAPVTDGPARLGFDVDRLHGHLWSEQLRRWIRLSESEKFELIYYHLANLYREKI